MAPAQVRKPKDKAAVEGGVRIVTMRMAAARDRVFDSLDTLNLYLANELSELNHAPFQKRVGSRDSVLAEERLHLLPLPNSDFYAPRYLLRKVARDYHVDYDCSNSAEGGSRCAKAFGAGLRCLMRLSDMSFALESKKQTAWRAYRLVWLH